MIIEGLIIAGFVAFLGGFGALTVTVYRMSGVIENGLTDDLKALATDVRLVMDKQGRVLEEQARQGARIARSVEEHPAQTGCQPTAMVSTSRNTDLEQFLRRAVGIHAD